MAITQTTATAMRKTALVGNSESGFIWNILTTVMINRIPGARKLRVTPKTNSLMMVLFKSYP